MNLEEFASFVRDQGPAVIKAGDAYWQRGEGIRWLILTATPGFRAVCVGPSEMAWLLRRCLVLRFPSEDATLPGRMTYAFDVRDKSYDLPSLSSKARNQTRRGLERCTISSLDYDYLAEVGPEINESAIARQGRKGSPANEYRDKKAWVRYLEVCRRHGCEIVGAFVGDVLASYLVGFDLDKCFVISNTMSRTEMLSSYPNNALIFSVVKEKMKDSRLSSVSYGGESDDQSLDHFKTSMGFMKRELYHAEVVAPPIAFPMKAYRIARGLS